MLEVEPVSAWKKGSFHSSEHFGEGFGLQIADLVIKVTFVGRHTRLTGYVVIFSLCIDARSALS
jgi:hypothetical protein